VIAKCIKANGLVLNAELKLLNFRLNQTEKDHFIAEIVTDKKGRVAQTVSKKRITLINLLSSNIFLE